MQASNSNLSPIHLYASYWLNVWPLPHAKQIVSETTCVDEKNIFFDDSDLANIAASLACTSHPVFSLLADAIFLHLSPRLGEDLPQGISIATDIGELQSLAEYWGLMKDDNDDKNRETVWKDRVALWEIITDEVTFFVNCILDK